jgi:sterol desaturase/sphingolipid hydroxylase (fatty acid hydroxylase superfamily)
MIFWFLAGCAGWTFIEYGMHHWNGHLLKGRTEFSREHLKHHTLQDYFAPLSKKVTVAVIVSTVIGSLGTALLGPTGGIGFAMGVVAGYGFYEYLHWANHMKAPRSAYARWARRHHFSHHFTDARYNHGVTTPIWDMVFGTYRQPEQIKVPSKLAMGWLLNEQGELQAEFAKDYRLSGRKRAPGRVIVHALV